MFLLGITGGSGSGKTTLLRAAERLGACALDCDAIYHGLLQSDAALLEALRAAFPAAFVGGTLSRPALAAEVFSDREKLLRLNALTHGHVERAVRARLRQAEAAGTRFAAVDAIALFESGLSRLCDKTVAVLAPLDVRVARLTARDGISADRALARIHAQPSDGEFSAKADFILQNSGSIAEFDTKCTEFLKGVYPMEETKYEALRKPLFADPKNGYDRISEADRAAMEPYIRDYMDFISTCKIEREAVDWTIAEAEKAGFVALRPGMSLKPGDRVYGNNRGKSVIFAVIGSEPLDNGTHICAAHIDSPRLDL